MCFVNLVEDMKKLRENQILLKKMCDIENSKKEYPSPYQVKYYTDVNRERF